MLDWDYFVMLGSDCEPKECLPTVALLYLLKRQLQGWNRIKTRLERAACDKHVKNI